MNPGMTIETLAFCENVVLLKAGDESRKLQLDGKFVLVDVDGFTTNREERVHFADHDYVLYYEEDAGPGDVVLEPPLEAVRKMTRKKVYYYPKNQRCEDFMHSIPDVELHRFSSPEALIVSHYYFKVLPMYEYWLFVQMVCAFPNVDMFEIHEVTNRNLPEYMGTEEAKRLFACAQRKDQMRSLPQAVDCVDRFPVDLSQKFEKFKSVGIIGLTDFTRRVAEHLTDKMFVDIYDEDHTVEALRGVSRDATNNINSILRNCNAIIVAKDYDISAECMAGKMVFDVCGAYDKRQSPTIKTLGKRGWIVWQ